MATPRQQHNPAPDRDADKRRALKLAARAVEKATDAERQKRAALRFALESGASLREVEAATGVPFKTVQRLAERDE